MDDEKAAQDEVVEILAGVLLAEEGFAPEHITPALRDIARHRATNFLSALAARGCEVVRWRPIAAVPKVEDGTEYFYRQPMHHKDHGDWIAVGFCKWVEPEHRETGAPLEPGWWDDDNIDWVTDGASLCILRGPQGETP